MKPLSIELANTLNKIENYKLDLEIINNFNFSENNFRKIYLSQLKSNSNSIKSDFTNLSSSLNSSNTDKIKSVFDNPECEFDHFFRMSSPIFLAVLAHLVKF